MKEHKIIIISTWESPYVVPLVVEAIKNNIQIQSIIYEPIFEKGMKIHRERTKDFIYLSMFDIEYLKIPSYFVSNHNSRNCIKLLNNLKPDIIINGGISRIIKQDLLDIPKIGVLNCHPGMLPKYRGCTCVEWALYNNDPVGATCHFMNAEIDAGAIITSDIMPIGKLTYEEIRTKIFYHSINVMIAGINRVIHDNLDIDKLPKQKQGIYHSVIPADKLEIVKNKFKKLPKWECEISNQWN